MRTPPWAPLAALHSSWGRLTVAAVVLLGLGGCVSSHIEQFKGAPTGLAEGENVVILARQHHSTHEAEQGFTRCLSSSLNNRRNGMRVVSSSEFLDALYPWFEPSIAPLEATELSELLSQYGVSDRLAQQGVRYVVWIDGNTERVDGGGGLSCAISPHGGGCFGLAWWQTDANYDVAIWDLQNSNAAGTITADVTGRSVIPAVVIPLPFIAPTRRSACRGLANQIEEFITLEGGLSF